MASSSVTSLTRRLDKINLSSESSQSSTRPLQIAPVSTKLLSKYAAPNPFSKPTPGSSLRHQVQSAKLSPTDVVDIGTYDGGLDADNEGKAVTGEAAETLALDSSVSGYV